MSISNQAQEKWFACQQLFPKTYLQYIDDKSVHHQQKEKSAVHLEMKLPFCYNCMPNEGVKSVSNKFEVPEISEDILHKSFDGRMKQGKHSGSIKTSSNFFFFYYQNSFRLLAKLCYITLLQTSPLALTPKSQSRSTGTPLATSQWRASGTDSEAEGKRKFTHKLAWAGVVVTVGEIAILGVSK